MNDKQLRDLQRRYAQSGLASDEAAWLRARVQVGLLEARRLEQAAYVGYPAARLALADPPALPTPAAPGQDDWPGLRAWAAGFRSWKRPEALRVALAAVEDAWADWESHFALESADAIRGWIESARAWVECPCEEHAEQVEEACQVVLIGGVPPGGGYVADAAFAVARMARGEPFSVLALHNSLLRPSGAQATAEVLEAIAAELGAWLLYEHEDADAT